MSYSCGPAEGWPPHCIGPKRDLQCPGSQAAAYQAHVIVIACPGLGRLRIIPGFAPCPGGGIGRRTGLKIPRQRWRAGSTPAPGTSVPGLWRRLLEHLPPQWNFQALRCGVERVRGGPGDGTFAEAVGAIQEADGVVLGGRPPRIHAPARVEGLFSPAGPWPRCAVGGCRRHRPCRTRRGRSRQRARSWVGLLCAEAMTEMRPKPCQAPATCGRTAGVPDRVKWVDQLGHARNGRVWACMLAGRWW